jgi:asparagine synthetase B (glutamine-hydrolysing)
VLSEPLVVPRDGCIVSLQATVLQMRKECIGQPVAIPGRGEGEKDVTSYFCWNGEVYQMLSANLTEPTTETNNTSDDSSMHCVDVWQYNQSDTLIVANMLSPLLVGPLDGPSLSQEIANTMSRLINAEFAFLILTLDAIYYGRDVWGRRSLLRWECPVCGSFRIASVAEEEQEGTSSLHDSLANESLLTAAAAATEWSEIEPGEVAEYRFDTTTLSVVDFSLRFKQLSSKTWTPSPPELSLSSVSSSSPPPSGVSDEMWIASFLLEEVLTSSVAMRLDYHETRSPVGILFSGGLDSVVLAALAIRAVRALALETMRNTSEQQLLQPNQRIFLYNVSFGPDYENSADRKAALVSYQALQELFPDQDVVFQDIVVGWGGIVEQEPHIRTLLAPKTTLMDVNIATALWFASRGEGTSSSSTISSTSSDTTTTPNVLDHAAPRVLLVGMGADEQFGGYGRHRKAFQKNGWDGLRQELNMDQSRLWERNLGRDDRICADHGKEARFPYLDPRIVQFLQDLPLEYVCDFALPPGQGDKRLLRLVASRLGLDHAGGLVKRAIQFGSRISHVSDAKRFGSRRQAKGQATVLPS